MVSIIRMKNKKLSAFTLIELVIAVALLAILVAVAIAAYQNITQKAQITNVKATLKRVRSSILIQKANNELSDSRTDGCHPRINFWPTFEEVRRSSYENQISGSILDSMMPPNLLIDNPRTPPFTNVFAADTDCNHTDYDNPDTLGDNIANNLVVAAPSGTPKGMPCPAEPCGAGWVYNPYTGEFWANSTQFDSNHW